MKRWSQIAALVALSAGVIACAGDDAAENRTPAAGTPAATGTSGAAANVDREFIEEQLADGNMEIELGRLAQDKASNAQVREFGAMMVRDHTNAGEELRQIVTKHNLQTSAAAHEEHTELRERLTKLSGAEFDREYIKAMVDDHEKAVNDVEDKAEGANNAEVKQWAAKTLPTLRQHLDRARQIQNSLGSK